ncbi:protein kinase domain-containing protein [Anabaena sp. UHCC 0451]|uniref:protein kinase domain-containing protein n=1 Tax=Anabaena sp. UHCC 0451 TaxID=2055235 RepID=UPI002B209B37|nr:IMS domain-containing protein [Anabaena sp. UHCC 0451]MEA5576526.1 IMS domain-containing protein [Anabaena sp. UHCC 0451]
MTQTLVNNRYQVLRILGSGGFGKTFLAEDTQMPSSKRCVVKQLIPVVNNPQVYQLVQERFQQEAAILEELGDRNSQIPRLYAYFSEDGEFYLVQEYIEGQTLSEKLKQQGVFHEIIVKEILINILQILEYVHSKGIVHRDIKPDNIILRFADSKPVLIDFGAVKVTMNTEMSPSGNPTQSIVIGTPGFMPMEQTVGRPVFSSDLYSLGLTAIYLLTSKVPQELPTDPNTGNILWRHFAPYLNVNFGDILDKAIAYHPRDRYLNSRDMLTALQTISNPVAPTVPFPPSTPTVIAAPVTPAYVPPTTVTSPPTSQPHLQTQYPVTPANSLGTWQQAVIIGGVIGTFIVAGLWVLGMVNKPQQQTASNNTSQPENSLQENTNTTPPDISNTPTITPETIQPETTSYISQAAAIALLERWLEAKREIFSPPYNKQLGAQFLTGSVYTKFITKTDDPDACLARSNNEDDCLSSVDWLQRNGAYWVYGVQKIQTVNDFVSSGNNATIVVVITEQRTLYNSKGGVDKTQSGLFTSTTSYDLQYENGDIKISNYK